MSNDIRSRIRAAVKVDPDTGCWIWQRAVDAKHGYGRIHANGRTVGAHVASYEAFVGPVPAGLELDHVAARGCTARACVNPAHLEPVTHAENVARAARTECPAGHPYDEVNTYTRPDGGRDCRTCRRAASNRYARRTREAVPA